MWLESLSSIQSILRESSMEEVEWKYLSPVYGGKGII